MAETAEATVDTTTVKALVTLTVAPQEGQNLAEAGEEMLKLVHEYLTSREHPFLTDYGTTAEELAKFRSGEDTAEEPTWGGYEGPFALEVEVSNALVVWGGETPAPGTPIPVGLSDRYYRDMGDTYARIALQEKHNLARKRANAAEAEKYYAIAERLEAMATRSSV